MDHVTLRMDQQLPAGFMPYRVWNHLIQVLEIQLIWVEYSEARIWALWLRASLGPRIKNRALIVLHMQQCSPPGRRLHNVNRKRHVSTKTARNESNDKKNGPELSLPSCISCPSLALTVKYIDYIIVLKGWKKAHKTACQSGSLWLNDDTQWFLWSSLLGSRAAAISEWEASRDGDLKTYAKSLVPSKRAASHTLTTFVKILLTIRSRLLHQPQSGSDKLRSCELPLKPFIPVSSTPIDDLETR